MEQMMEKPKAKAKPKSNIKEGWSRIAEREAALVARQEANDAHVRKMEAMRRDMEKENYESKKADSVIATFEFGELSDEDEDEELEFQRQFPPLRQPSPQAPSRLQMANMLREKNPPPQNGSKEALVVVEPRETCEENWQKHKGDLQVLIAMSIGLKTEDGSRNLADLDLDDMYVLHLSKQYYPRAPVLTNEMARRAKNAGLKKFRKSSLSKPEKMNWLKDTTCIFSL
jgi:hypothetical protein